MLISSMERLVIFPFSGCQGTGRNVLHFNSAGRLIYRQLIYSQLPISSLPGVEIRQPWPGLEGPREMAATASGSGCFCPSHFLGVMYKHRDGLFLIGTRDHCASNPNGTRHVPLKSPHVPRDHAGVL